MVLGGVCDLEYLRAFSKKIVPVLESFYPNLVIFSAGFDAHEQDPLGMMKVSTRGFDSMHDLILDKLQSLNIPCFFVLEGGYNLQSLSECTVSLFQNLVGRFSIN